MNIIRKIVTAGVAALALGGMAATTAASTASASANPIVYSGRHGWTPNGPPSTIVLQTYRGHWLVWIRSIHWQRTNKGTGEIEFKSPVRRGYSHDWGSLHVSDIKTHHGVRYYDVLRFSGGNAATWHNGHWNYNGQ